MNKKRLLAATRPLRHTVKQLRRMRPHHWRAAVRACRQRLAARWQRVTLWLSDHRGCSCSICRGAPV